MSNVEPRFLTSAVHAGVEIEPLTGAVMPPIFLSSTFAQDEPGQLKRGFDYSRAGNPSRDGLERALAELESAQHALAFASGLAAEQAIIQSLEPGSKVVVTDDVYGGTGRLFRRLYAKYQLDFHFIDMSNDDEVKQALTANTKLIWIETPTNPMMKIVDIRKLCKLARNLGAISVVDNTFASPINQSPLALGADIVMHSATKYLGGHSDIIGGCIMTNDTKLYEQLKFIQFAAGAVPSPFDCYLLHRSLKTLAIRMQQHEINAHAVAEFLASHKSVDKVYYPGLKDNPFHQLAKEQMRGFSGMVSFNHAGTYDDVVRFFSKLKLFTLAESLGGVESLANHPERMTHASVPPEMRKKLGIGPNLIRLSCGIEAPEDLISDLAQALQK